MISQQDEMPKVPAIWGRVLVVLAIGKAAIAGAGAALAILGAFDIAMAVTAQEWLKSFRANYLEEIALAGGMIGAVLRAFILR